MKFNRFALFSWGVLGYNLLVILWGAYVRATGSGAGCGAHWPLCNGEIVPQAPAITTMVEFTHRITSGISLVLVIVLFIWAFRAYPKGHIVRFGAKLSLIFIITEALLGAGLVLFQLVADNASGYRAVSIAAHLINTFLLLAAFTLTGWWASGGAPLRLRGSGALGWALLIGLIGVIVIGATGAITALGDTLFRTDTLAEGVRHDFAETAHFLERLRIVHPIAAVTVSIYVTGLSWWLSRRLPGSLTERVAWTLTAIFLGQLVLGAINMALLAPVWMQMVHLLAADILWICLILLCAVALSDPQAVPVSEKASSPSLKADRQTSTQ